MGVGREALWIKGIFNFFKKGPFLHWPLIRVTLLPIWGEGRFPGLEGRGLKELGGFLPIGVWRNYYFGNLVNF